MGVPLMNRQERKRNSFSWGDFWNPGGCDQIDLEKPCRSPPRMPQNLDSGAKIGLATCLGTLVPIWPRGGRGFEPSTARNQEPRP